MTAESEPRELSRVEAFIHHLEALLPKLDRLADVMVAQQDQSSQTLSLLRGSLNGLLWSGTVTFTGSAGSWLYDQDFTVPFGAIAYADFGAFGPFIFDATGTQATRGPGVYTSFGSDAGQVPLVGRHLHISTASSSATPPQLYVAVLTGTSELQVG